VSKQVVGPLGKVQFRDMQVEMMTVDTEVGKEGREVTRRSGKGSAVLRHAGP
jgi:hypothetical protein